MPQSQSQAIKMVISQPTNFEQSDEICSFIKEKKLFVQVLADELEKVKK